MTSEELPFQDLDNLKATHAHEEELHRQSMSLVEANPEWKLRLILAEKGLAIIYAATHDYVAKGENELTLQFLGIRLFNTGASAVKLGLSGYYQQGFGLLRDVLEVGFLIHFFKYWPEKITEWRSCTEEERRKVFAPVKIRIALDEKEGNVEKKRAKAYETLSQYGSHATFRGFRMTTPAQGLGLIGPFVDETILRAFIEELVLRLGPVSIIYATLFPALHKGIQRFAMDVSKDLIENVRGK